MNLKRLISAAPLLLLLTGPSFGAENVIEKQLAEIGRIPNDEVVVVQRKFTRKNWRHQLTPIMFGGVPFGTVRRTLIGGASYTLHASDQFGFELLNFSYSKTFFSSFTDDINAHKERPDQADIKPDYQKLLYFLTTGIQYTPFYGKVSTLSRYIAYIEPYLTLGVGLAKTESDAYLTAVPGVGVRAFFKEWLSMQLEFRDYIYNEKFVSRTAAATETTAFRNNYAVTLSLSFWLPKMPR